MILSEAYLLSFIEKDYCLLAYKDTLEIVESNYIPCGIQILNIIEQEHKIIPINKKLNFSVITYNNSNVQIIKGENILTLTHKINNESWLCLDSFGNYQVINKKNINNFKYTNARVVDNKLRLIKGRIEQVTQYIKINIQIDAFNKKANMLGLAKFEYDIDENNVVTLKKIIGDIPDTNKPVIVPNYVDQIAKNALGDAPIKAVIIDGKLKRIESTTFFNANKLEYIRLNKELQEIDNGAFRLCTNLQKIEFNDNLEYIGYKAFLSCGLHEVDLSNTKIKFLEADVFALCKLKTLKLPRELDKLDISRQYGCIETLRRIELSIHTRLIIGKTVREIKHQNKVTIKFYEDISECSTRSVRNRILEISYLTKTDNIKVEQ